MVYIGLKEFIEDCGTKASFFQRISLHCFSVQVTKSNPSYIIFPEAIPPMERILPMIVQTTVLFPHPEFPCRQSVSPFFKSNDNEFTLQQLWFLYWIDKFCTDNIVLIWQPPFRGSYFLQLYIQSTSNQNLKSQCKSPAELPTITMHPS